MDLPFRTFTVEKKALTSELILAKSDILGLFKNKFNNFDFLKV